MSPDLAHVESWIFDLDNSLYPHDSNLFELIDVRMGEYIQRLLGVDAIEARRVQKSFFHAHGTTLAGLIAEHNVDPHDFLDYVHDIDLARLAADPALVAALDALPGRKFVFTNASEGYARRVLARLGLANAFDGNARHPCDGLCAEARSVGLCGALRAPPHRSQARALRRRHGAQPRAGQGDRHDHALIDNGSEQGPEVARPISSTTDRTTSPLARGDTGEKVA